MAKHNAPPAIDTTDAPVTGAATVTTVAPVAALPGAAIPVGSAATEHALATLPKGDAGRLLALTEKLWLGVERRRALRAEVLAAQTAANEKSAEVRRVEIELAAFTQERDGIEMAHSTGRA